MKWIIYFLAILLPFTGIKADVSSSDSITHSFTRKSGKNNLYVLQLKAGGKYDHCRYTDKKTYHDYGTYTIKHGKIIFKSQNSKRGFSSVGNKTLFINENGIYPTRVKAWTGKDPVAETSADSKYKQDWAINPLTGTKNEGPSVKAKVDAPNFGYDADFNASEFVKSYYQSLTEKYAQPYAAMISENYCGPGCYLSVVNGQTVGWSGDTSKANMFKDFETMVHETVHHRNGFNNIFVAPGLEIKIPHNDVYHSEEFVSIVPKDAPGKIFRYNTYVGAGSKVSANVSGIFGLMDEFSAYQNGCTAALMAAKTALAATDTATAKKFLAQASGTYFAYYEFRLFIAWYLRYGESKYPDQYADHMNNKNLRVAFTLNEAVFANTVSEFMALNNLIGNKSTVQYYESTYAQYCKTQLESEDVVLEKFRVKGVTTANYQSFLEKKK